MADENTENKVTLFSRATFSNEAGENEGAKRVRSFSGVAYTGDVIRNHSYWGDVIFDLSKTELNKNIPALINHNFDKRCGFVQTIDLSNEAGISVTGRLLSNEYGATVAAESDEGFPWQMSISIQPEVTREIPHGQTETINGRSVSGPCCVFENSVISEVSFTAVGWDSNTKATALSKNDAGASKPTTGENSMTIEELEAKLSAAQAENAALKQEVADAKAALTEFSKKVRTDEIKHLFSKIGREYKEDDTEVKTLGALDNTAFSAMSAMLMAAKPAEPNQVAAAAQASNNTLFSHAANAGAEPQAQAAVNPLLADAQQRANQFSKS